jgi:hypothetical protein
MAGLSKFKKIINNRVPGKCACWGQALWGHAMPLMKVQNHQQQYSIVRAPVGEHAPLATRDATHQSSKVITSNRYLNRARAPVGDYRSFMTRDTTIKVQKIIKNRYFQRARLLGHALYDAM